MQDRTARVFSGLGVLVLVWIGVYWMWPAGDDGSTLSGGSLSGLSTRDGELDFGDIEPLPTPARSAERGGAGVRFPPAGGAAPSDGGEPGPVGDDDGGAATGERASDSVDRSGGRPAGVGVIPPSFDDYVIKPGDNFERISQKVYGTRRHAMAIARSNPLLDPRKLRAGDSIRVPRDPSNIQGVPVDGDGEPADRPVPDSAAETIEYTVKRGDTLSGIATAFYGSITHVDFLYRANRDRMTSKDDLRLGQVLRIPPLPEGAD